MPEGVELLAPGDDDILSPAALAFVARLHRELNPVRLELLERRAASARPSSTQARSRTSCPRRACVRESDWSVAPAPPDLLDRRVEITGPLDRKMMINAINSGARVFMADFEDALSPTWQNVVEGQRNLADAVRGTIELETERKAYRLNEEPAVLIPRPRGWHLPERHVLVDGEPVSASLFDFGLAFFHNAARAARARLGAVLLPAQAREPSGGAALERRIRPGPGRARARPAGRFAQPSSSRRSSPPSRWTRSSTSSATTPRG